MTTQPLARYGAPNGALASGLTTSVTPRPGTRPALELEDGPQGTVWFNRDVRVYRKTSSYRTTNSVRQTHTTTTRTGFKCIDAPRTVYQMILGQMHSKRVDEAVTG